MVSGYFESDEARRQVQRFSWQAPIEIEEASPVYQQVPQHPPWQEVTNVNNASFPQPSHQTAAGHQQNSQHQRYSWQMPQQAPEPPAPSNTVAPQHSRGFSYAPTPVEHRAQNFFTSTQNDPPLPTSPCTPIDSRPQSMLPLNAALELPASNHPQDEKPPISPVPSPVSSQDGTHTIPFSPVSPIATPQPTQQQQYVQQQYTQPQQPPQQTRHARQMSNLPPLHTNLSSQPMPTIPQSPFSATNQYTSPHVKTPATALTTSPTRKDTPQTPPYTPHATQAPQIHPDIPPFSPLAPHGPNGLAAGLHAPGQISHPNMDASTPQTWSHGLFSCTDFATCMMGLFCPCVLHSRTAYRLSQKSAHRDASDTLGHQSINAHCALMSLACGLWCLFPGVQRARVRRAYKIQGGGCADMAAACCCCCCVVVQNEREVREREEKRRRWAGPATVPYGREEGMKYVPQQH
jgi:Cys-rich protein (TIGR01571 family)